MDRIEMSKILIRNGYKREDFCNKTDEYLRCIIIDEDLK